MSQAEFPRKDVIAACGRYLDEIALERRVKIRVAEQKLQDFDVRVSATQWWQGAPNKFARYDFELQLRQAENYNQNKLKRVQRILDFCLAIKTDTVTLSALEFADFNEWYV